MGSENKIVMMGNDAMGEAAMRCGCKFFAGYPISPQTQILDYLARQMPKRGCTFIQADSELGAINMVIGASIAGERAMVASSSTGLALMYEAFGAAANGGFPMVIVDVTREGVAQTGIKASQSDYNMLTKSFGDGGLRVPVLVPSTVQELAEMVGQAFDMADRYRTPVVIMTEPTTAQTIECVDFSKVMPNKKYDKRMYTPSGRDTRPTPGSLRVEDSPHDFSNRYGPETMQIGNMEHFRANDLKCKEIAKNEVLCEEFMMEDAEYVIAAFGAPARYGIDSVKDLRAEGYKVGMIRPIMVYPFPEENFKRLTPDRIKGVLAVEMCIPEAFYHDVREYVPDATPVESCSTAGGVIADCDKIEEAFRKHFGNK
ncbi:MAG: thiamine pyrophosphate-binding protein [Dysosmobacter sp.]|nr:thiamine pyrophosphate-binding protein [Dysosmobacter sp.]